MVDYCAFIGTLCITCISKRPKRNVLERLVGLLGGVAKGNYLGRG
jgi:hypothetical protein